MNELMVQARRQLDRTAVREANVPVLNRRLLSFDFAGGYATWQLVTEQGDVVGEALLRVSFTGGNEVTLKPIEPATPFDPGWSSDRLLDFGPIVQEPKQWSAAALLQGLLKGVEIG